MEKDQANQIENQRIDLRTSQLKILVEIFNYNLNLIFRNNSKHYQEIILVCHVSEQHGNYDDFGRADLGGK